MAEKTLKLKFVGDASGVNKAFDQIAGKASGLERAFGGFAKVGKFALLGIAGATALAAPKLFNLSKEIELMGKKAATVLADQLPVVEAWAKQSATAMGLTQAKTVGLAANFADLLIPMGFARDKAAEMSTNVVGLSGALAEWSGGTRSAAEVSQILAKAMLGERESLKELGISITQADVDARVLANGQAHLTGQQLEQAKATATQQLIFEKSRDAQAAFEAGSGSLARMQAELKTTFENTKEQLATALIPVFKTVIETVSQVVAWFKEHEGVAKSLGIVVGGVLTLAIGAYTISMFGAAAATIAATWPILAIIGIVAGLAFGVKKLAEAFGISWADIRSAVGSVAGWIGSQIERFILAPIRDMIRLIMTALDVLRRLRDAVSSGWRSHVGASAGFGLPSLQHGGFIPAGVVTPAILHGPEYVIPARGGRAAGGTPVINVFLNVEGSVVTERDLVERMRDGIISLQRRNTTSGII